MTPRADPSVRVARDTDGAVLLQLPGPPIAGAQQPSALGKNDPFLLGYSDPPEGAAPSSASRSEGKRYHPRRRPVAGVRFREQSRVIARECPATHIKRWDVARPISVDPDVYDDKVLVIVQCPQSPLLGWAGRSFPETQPTRRRARSNRPAAPFDTFVFSSLTRTFAPDTHPSITN